MTEKSLFPCFFCDIGKEKNERIAQGEHFYSRYSDFPVSKGHSEIVALVHINSFFVLQNEQFLDFVKVLQETKKILDKQFSVQGYNIGINDGEVAGASIDHLHIHLIPRYFGDVINPKGGVRNILPGGDYTQKCAEEMPERSKYLK